NDTDAAYELVSEFAPDACGAHAVAIIKHANPCGVALAGRQDEALRMARACDPVSAFGGIVAVSDTVRLETAQAIIEAFTEVVIAPAYAPDALDVFARKKDLRVLRAGDLAVPGRPGEMVRTIAGGRLVQSRDAVTIGRDDMRVVTERAPTEDEFRDLMFAFIVAKHVKSNAIVYAKNGATVGIGAGQMSRVDSARIAVRKGADAAAAAGQDEENLVVGSVVASDAFFPFADGLITAAEAGATAVIQPGGSIRDEEVIAAANDKGLAMVFTGVRHFRH
ncbi:MAG: bifunctional phosphoribosylaminoimidazolecarboxamide formyltransferase/IMP cyclohydrolase, partial [Pseudomonadota bacterium]